MAESNKSPKAKPLLIAELSWSRVAEHMERDRRLIIPIGTCEQHGRHLPLGTDTLLAERLAHDLSAEFGVLVAPTVSYGVNIDTGHDHSGTASLRRKTLHRVLNDLLASWERHGFEEFILITTNFHDPHLDAVTTVVTEHARLRVVDTQSVRVDQFLEKQEGPEHAGEAETSLMMFLFPGLVLEREAQDYVLDPKQTRGYFQGRLPQLPVEFEGTIGHPSAATAAKGKKIYEYVLNRIRSKVFLSEGQAEDDA